MTRDANGGHPLRLLFLADFVPDPNSGAAGTEIQLSAELVRQGHEVETVWGDRLPHRIHHWNLHHLLEQPRAYRAIVRDRLARGPVDVAHVNQPAGWLVARELRRRRAPVLLAHRSHGFEPRIGEVLRPWRRRFSEDRRPPLRRLASALVAPALRRHHRAIVRWADLHVVSCGECASYLSARGVPAERIHVSPQVPIQSYLDAPPAPWTPARARRLLFVGQHVFFKAPMVLAEALADLLAADPRLSATWVCEPAAHEAVRARLDPAVAGRVRLLGWMPQRELMQVYDEHGVFLFPSFTEGFGKVFLEAMARGLCVVATDQGGARDVIRSGENGVKVPVGDARALASEARALIADHDASRRICDAARTTATAYTWTRVASALADFYGAAVARGRSEGV
jgi:glycosyltransferase involved in cell wall biosynthesis